MRPAIHPAALRLVREVGPWLRADNAANLSAQTLPYCLNSASSITYYAAKACSIVGVKMLLGIGVASGGTNTTITAGTATLNVYKNGSLLSGPSAQCGVGDFYKLNEYAPGLYQLAESDRIDLRLTTSADMLPSGSIDVVGWIQLQF